MHKDPLPALRVSTAILTVSGYLALSTTAAFGIEIVVVPLFLLLLMPLFERIDEAWKGYRYITNVLTVAFTVFIVPFLMSPDRLIVGLTAVVIYIQVYLLLHRKGVREYRYLFLMAFFLLVDACAQDPDAGFGLVMPLFILSAVWAFALTQVFAEYTANKAGDMADILPRDERRGFLPPEVLQWANRGNRRNWQLNATLGMLSLSCIVATLLIFLLTPRMEAGILGRSNVVPLNQRTDLTERVDLSRGGRITADLEPVFQARIPAEQVSRIDVNDLHWRVSTLNRLVGARWDRVPLNLDEFSGTFRQLRDGRILERNVIGNGVLVEQEIFIEDFRDLPGLPALALVQRVEAEDARFQLHEALDYAVQVTRSRRNSITYKALSEIQDRNESVLRAASTDYVRALGGRGYNVLTEHRLSQRARALAQQIAGNVGTDYDKVRAIERYFRFNRDFFYTLDLEELPQDDPIDHFLFVTRAGNCELYASAMTLLVRSLGIPARLVLGYRGGDWSANDEAYTVRKSNAHVWVEVYFPGSGWVLFDPTPYLDDLDDSWQAVMTRFVTRQALNAKVMYYRDIIGFDRGINVGSLIAIGMGFISFDLELVRGALNLSLFRGTLPRLTFGAVSVIALLGVILYLRASAAHTRHAGKALVYTPDQVRARRLFRKLKKRLGRSGIDCRGLTAREVLAVAQAEAMLDVEPVRRLVLAYDESRFGGRPMTKQAYAELVAQLATLVKRRR
jgi:transglutaminase-like putative cysteine protease